MKWVNKLSNESILKIHREIIYADTQRVEVEEGGNWLNVITYERWPDSAYTATKYRYYDSTIEDLDTGECDEDCDKEYRCELAKIFGKDYIFDMLEWFVGIDKKTAEKYLYIGEVLEPGDKDIVLDACPSCGKPLTEINGQQFCTNPICEERIAQNIAFLGKKDVLDIPGLSIQTARKMVSAYPGIADVYEQNMIFKLDYEDLKALPGFAEKSAKKLFHAIQQARVDVELPRFIKALCIPGIGNDIGKILADEFGDLYAMHTMFSYAEDKWSDVVTKLQAINGIGPVTAKILCSGKFWDAVYDLHDAIISIAPYEKKEIAKGKLAGKTFVLTGKMKHTRDYYEGLIEKAGRKVASTVSKTTDFLVIADVNSASSKAKKARELGTELISPEELEEMLS